MITTARCGIRFLPITKSQLKEMLPLVDKPLIQHSVEEVLTGGVELVTIVTAQGKRAIEDHFGRSFELKHFLGRRARTSCGGDASPGQHGQHLLPFPEGVAKNRARRACYQESGGWEPFVYCGATC